MFNNFLKWILANLEETKEQNIIAVCSLIINAINYEIKIPLTINFRKIKLTIR